MLDRILAYIRQHELIRAGDRVGVAVSGGADSVALLRLIVELRSELGVVLAVVHFNHKIRGADAEADEHFVADLAAAHRLEFYCDSADTPVYAREHGLSLEAAGRELRYGFFAKLLRDDLNTIATAHTMDDQAETVLLRVMRGAGTRGLAGIYPKWSVGSGQRSEKQAHGYVVRPLLQVRRAEVRQYLKSLKQSWREDASNLDVKHTRNRLRHELLPLIEREFNPSVVVVLAEMAEVARAEEEYWEGALHGLKSAQECNNERLGGTTKVVPSRLSQQTLAVQRRLVRDFAEEHGLRLEFQHVERILEAVGEVEGLKSKLVELPERWRLRCTARELRLERGSQIEGGPGGYEYRLPVPGEVEIVELGVLLKASRVTAGAASSGYNHRQLLDPHRLAPELVVRNWRPGDRFRPAHSKSAKKLKELLLRRRIAQPQRALWPVVLSGDAIVWVPGLGPAAEYAAAKESAEAVVIEEVNIGPCGTGPIMAR